MSATSVMDGDAMNPSASSEQFAYQTPNLDGLMSEAEFCKRIKICRASLFKLRKARLIGFVTKGKRIFYDNQSYQDYLANCTKRVEPMNGSPVTSAVAPRRSSRRGIRRRNG
ncbi:MAG: hypothetical protein WBV94_04955 [Blastocatellia bacterium]